MNGIISLLSGFSIETVLKGRVSLAHLLEFSNFVDLYVLEEKIFASSLEKEHGYQEFYLLPNSPIEFLTDKIIENHVDSISMATGFIYDESPEKKFTFSFDSYGYWTGLKDNERKEWIVGYDQRFKKFITNQEALLSNDRLNYSASEIDNGIINLLEIIGKTQYSLTPSTRNLLPFLESFHQLETPALKLYKSIAAEHKKLVEKLIEFQRPRMIYLPPLLSILLSRCNTSEEIPIRLDELRQEYSDLRKEIRELSNEMNTKRTLKEQIEIRELFDQTLIDNSKKFDLKQKGFYKNIGNAFLDAFDDGNLSDILYKPGVALVKEGINNMPDIFKSKRLTGFINLLNDSYQVYDYQNLLKKVFKERLDVSQYEITQIKKYYKYVGDNYNINNYYQLG